MTNPVANFATSQLAQATQDSHSIAAAEKSFSQESAKDNLDVKSDKKVDDLAGNAQL